jgi:hypothetical protein
VPNKIKPEKASSHILLFVFLSLKLEVEESTCSLKDERSMRQTIKANYPKG